MAPNEIGRVAIVGGGVMGAGIAEVCARADLYVTVIEASDQRAGRTSDAIERSLQRAVGVGKLDAEAADAAKRQIAVSAELADAAGADAAIEAITEDEGQSASCSNASIRSCRKPSSSRPTPPRSRS